VVVVQVVAAATTVTVALAVVITVVITMVTTMVTIAMVVATMVARTDMHLTVMVLLLLLRQHRQLQQLQPSKKLLFQVTQKPGTFGYPAFFIARVSLFMAPEVQSLSATLPRQHINATLFFK
jgi:hypothetical protein